MHLENGFRDASYSSSVVSPDTCTSFVTMAQLRNEVLKISLHVLVLILIVAPLPSEHKIHLKLIRKISYDEQDNEKLQEVREVALLEHNKLRKLHGVPSLTEDEQLHLFAQKYAALLASLDKFDHSADNEFGENLMLTSADDQIEAVRIAVESWYEEIDLYDYKKPGYREDTAHFTEMIWRSNTHVGVGVAWNEKQEQWVAVANYKPGGNVDAEYQENVPPRQNKLMFFTYYIK